MSRKKNKKNEFPTNEISSLRSSSFHRHSVLLLMGILLITFITFSPVLQNGFVNWDDPEYIEKNYFIKSFTNENLREIFTSYFIANYQPLTILSYAVEYHFTQLNPKLYHLTNLLLHLMNTALVFYFILLLIKKREVAVITALLFGIHPMHVESVAWIAERKDVLYTFFYLLASICYLHYTNEEKTKTKFYSLALLAFLFSILSKAMAVTLPLVILLIDFFSERKISLRKNIVEKLPFFTLSLIFGLVAVVAQKTSHAIRSDFAFTVLDKLLISGYEIALYLWKTLFVMNLSNYYPYPVKTGNTLPLIFYIVPFLLILTGYLIYYFRKNKTILFGFLFFLFQIGLVLQFIPTGNTIIAERYTYLSYIGLFFIAGQAFRFFYEKQNRVFEKIKIPLSLLAGAVLILFVLKTHARCKIWKDSLTLWKDALEKFDSAPTIYTNIGFAYHSNGKLDSAMNYYNKAINLSPYDEYSYANRGDLYLRVQQYNPALADINKALELNPEFELALNTKAALLFQLNQPDSALYYFNKVIALKKDYWEVCFNRGNVYCSLGKFELGIVDYNTYLRYRPQEADVYYWRGMAYFNLGNADEAINDFNTALKLNSFFKGDILLSRSRTFAMKNFHEQALQDALAARSWGMKVDENYLESLKK